MADWDTIQGTGDRIPNGHVAAKVDPLYETLPAAYSRRPAGPVHVSSNRYSKDKHLNENHMIYDKNVSTFMEETDKRPRKHGTVSVRRVYNREIPANKYATTRLPGEKILMNPITLQVEEDAPNARVLKPYSKLANGTVRGNSTAPVIFRKSGNKKHHHQGAFSPTSAAAGRLQSSFGLKKRQNSHRQEDFISFFDIETEKVENYQYRPGEEVAGAIKIIVKRTFEIKYVELVVVGVGLLTMYQGKDQVPKTVRETYLHKQTCVIGSNDAAWTSVLTAGRYTSKFKVKLPPSLPSSVHHEDQNNGYTFNVGYYLMARMCEEATRSSVRSTSSATSLRSAVRVIVSKKTQFQVQRAFDLHAIPGSLDAVLHTEQVPLSCTNQNAAVVSLQVDRYVFLAGDDIRMRLLAVLPGSQRVKEIGCTLEAEITYDPNIDPMTFTLSRMMCKDPEGEGRKLTSSQSVESTYDVTIPTQTQLISSFPSPSSSFKFSYFLAVVFKFNNYGGKLSFRVPIGIGPCAEPIYAEKISSRKFVPLFNRTTRFPYFSVAPVSEQSTPREHSARTTGSSISLPVVTTYSNSFWSRLILCCKSSGARDD